MSVDQLTAQDLWNETDDLLRNCAPVARCIILGPYDIPRSKKWRIHKKRMKKAWHGLYGRSAMIKR